MQLTKSVAMHFKKQKSFYVRLFKCLEKEQNGFYPFQIIFLPVTCTCCI